MADVQKEIALKVTTDVGQTTTALQSAEDRLTEAKKAMLELAMAGKQGSKEFRTLAEEAGRLKGRIESVEQTVDGIGKSTNKIEVFTGAVQGLAAGFAIAQGTAALFAEGNEEMQQALVRVQASLALLQGTEQAVQLLRRESAAGQAILTARTAAYNVVVGASTGALKLFRIALAATGIGAAVVAVGLLVANFDKVTKAVTDFVSGSPALTKVLKFIGDTFTSIGESLGFVEDKTTKNLRTQIEAAEKQKRLLEAQGKDTEAVERSILKMKLDVAKRTKEGVNEAQEEITIFEAEQTLKREELAKEAAKKRAEIEKAAIEKSKAERLKALEEQRAIDQIGIDAEEAKVSAAREAAQELAAIDEERRLATLTDFQRSIEDIKADSAARIELLRATGASENEVRMEQNRAIGLITQEFLDAEDVKHKEALEKKQLRDAQMMQNNFDLTKGGLQAIADLTLAFSGQSEAAQKRAFDVQKKVNIAIALIDTYLAAQKAFLSQMTLTPDSPIRAALAAGVAVAAGLARVAAIRNTTFGSASTSAAPQAIRPAGLSQGGQQPPAAFNPNVTPTTPQGQPQGQGMPIQPLRAFVVDRDIEMASSRRNRLRDFASI